MAFLMSLKLRFQYAFTGLWDMLGSSRYLRTERSEIGPTVFLDASQLKSRSNSQ